MASFVPQGALLARCRLVITHGGSGTMLGALASGVPLLMTPRGADQYDNAAAVVRRRPEAVVVLATER